MKLLPLAIVAILTFFCQPVLAQANKTKAIGTAGASSNNNLAGLSLRTKVDSLRKTGKTNEEIFRLLKSTTPPKLLMVGLKKTPPRIKTPVSNGSSNPAPPPPPAFTADDEADAIEMLQIMDEDGRGYYTTEQLSALWEIYEIPDLQTYLRIMYQAGHLHDEKILGYAISIGSWLQQANVPAGSSSGTRFPGPANWMNQYPAFFGIYQSNGYTAGRAFHEFRFGISARTPLSPPTEFIGPRPAESERLLLEQVAAAYNCTTDMVIRSAGEYRASLFNDSFVAFMTRMTSLNFSAEKWATLMKMDNVPNGSGGFYPAFTAQQATAALNSARYPTTQVMSAIRAVYQQ